MHILTVLLLLTSGCVRHYHYNVVVNPPVQESKPNVVDAVGNFPDNEPFVITPCDNGALCRMLFKRPSVVAEPQTCSPYDPMFKTDLPKCTNDK